MLAIAVGLRVAAHHVDHGHRSGTASEADRAFAIADQLGVPCTVHRVKVADGPNFEARARDARRSVIPRDAMTGHTLDDRAETVLMRLARGVGPGGLAVLSPGRTHPIARLRRTETMAVCQAVGVEPIIDPTNDDDRFQRNRVRQELLPLLDDIAERDTAPLIARFADLAAADDALLTGLADQLDPTDAAALAAAPLPLASRAIRRWLTSDARHRYPPDRATVDRVLDVAAGRHEACEIGGARRVARRRGQLRIIEPER